MHDAPNTRLVPISHADVSWLHTTADTPQRREALARVGDGFNRAPADPLTVAASALRNLTETDHIIGRTNTEAAQAVLRALGLPDA